MDQGHQFNTYILKLLAEKLDTIPQLVQTGNYFLNKIPKALKIRPAIEMLDLTKLKGVVQQKKMGSK